MAHIKRTATSAADTDLDQADLDRADRDHADDSGIVDTADLAAASSDAEEAETATPAHKRVKIDAEVSDTKTIDTKTIGAKTVGAKAIGGKAKSAKPNSAKPNSAKPNCATTNSDTEPEPAALAIPASPDAQDAPAAPATKRVRKTTSRDVDSECYGRLLAAVRKLHKEVSFEFNSSTTGVLAVGDVSDLDALRIFTFSITDNGSFAIADHDGNVVFRVLSRPSPGYAVQLLARSLFAALDRAGACE